MPLPFDLPVVSRGYAELDQATRAAGARAADQASRALAAVLGTEVRLSARAVPGRASPGSACASVALELRALPGTALLEVDAALVARLVDGLAGGGGDPVAATALTPVETSALDLLALSAIDGACGVPEIEALLTPRLVRAGTAPADALAIEMDVAAGSVRGRARLLLPPVAVRAVRAAPLEACAASAVAIGASVRSGRGALMPQELDALRQGDVVVMDEPPGERHALVLPGGARAEGRLAEEAFHVEEITMADRAAELPVTLEVEIARVTIPISDLARLEPGAVLPLGIDRRGTVVLRAGERAVARGELVDVDGAIGVRIHSVEILP